VTRAFAERHPWRLRLFSAILDWGNLDSEEAITAFVTGRPFLAFRPATPGTDLHSLLTVSADD
jgi:hypothetical protein